MMVLRPFLCAQVFQLTFVLVVGTIVFPLQHLFLDNKHEIRRIWTLWHNVFVSLVRCGVCRYSQRLRPCHLVCVCCFCHVV